MICTYFFPLNRKNLFASERVCDPEEQTIWICLSWNRDVRRWQGDMQWTRSCNPILLIKCDRWSIEPQSSPPQSSNHPQPSGKKGSMENNGPQLPTAVGALTAGPVRAPPRLSRSHCCMYATGSTGCSLATSFPRPVPSAGWHPTQHTNLVISKEKLMKSERSNYAQPILWPPIPQTGRMCGKHPRCCPGPEPTCLKKKSLKPPKCTKKLRSWDIWRFRLNNNDPDQCINKRRLGGDPKFQKCTSWACGGTWAETKAARRDGTSCPASQPLASAPAGRISQLWKTCV